MRTLRSNAQRDLQSRVAACRTRCRQRRHRCCVSYNVSGPPNEPAYGREISAQPAILTSLRLAPCVTLERSLYGFEPPDSAPIANSSLTQPAASIGPSRTSRDIDADVLRPETSRST